MKLDMETILAMAVAAVAEENGVQPKQVTVRSFKEIEKSSLEKYIEEKGISYQKYTLEETKA